MASSYLSKRCGISEAELILGKERVFVARQRPSLRACLSAQVLFPEFIRNILASVLFLGQEVQIARYIDALTKSLT